jgi:TetR/AcrR family transcriptional repressor of mexJK operon
VHALKTIKPRPGPRNPSETERRNHELLDRALDIFLEHGFEQTTIEAVAAAVGMAKRTVYLRYGNKLGLFKAAIRRAFDRSLMPISNLQVVARDNLEDNLFRIARILVNNAMSPKAVSLMRVINTESHRVPEIGACLYEQGIKPTTAYLADLFRHRMTPIGKKAIDADDAALAFLQLILGSPARPAAWHTYINDTMIEEHTQYCVKLFLHGLLQD